MDGFRRELIERLLTRGAIRLDYLASPFISINLRRPPHGLLTEGDADMIGAELTCMVKERVEPQFFDLVAGIPGSEKQFAEAFACIYAKPVLTIGKKVDGKYAPGQRLLLVSPQITPGADREREVIGIAEEAGLKVAGIAALIDLQQGGWERLQRADYYPMAAFTLDALLEHCVWTGRISRAKRDETMAALAVDR